MSAEYDIYLHEHRNNVKKACLWLTNNVKIPLEFVPDYYSEDILLKMVDAHDGYYIEYRGFRYRDLEHLDMIFSDYEQAKAKLDRLNSKENKR